MIHFTQKTQNNIIILTFDMQDKTVNLLDASTLKELKKCIKNAESDISIKGIIIQSAKDNFCHGADVTFIQKLLRSHTEPKALYDKIWDMQDFFQSFTKPIVAIINGQCLGGGLELALACHYRIGIKDTKLRLALPEVRLGIIPGLGGTQRLPRLIGLENALQMLLKGSPVREDTALNQGLIDNLCSTKTALTEAISYINNHNPKKDKAPHLYQPNHLMTLSAASALAKKQAQGCYINVENLLQAVYEGMLVDLNNGLKTETEYFVKTLLHPNTQAMLKTLYTDRMALRKKAKFAHQKHPITHLGVIGGGFMGSAIAAHALSNQLQVTVIEKDQDCLLKTKQTIDDLLAKYPPQKRPKLHISTELSKLNKCELVIEAVPEDMTLKQRTLSLAEQYLHPEAVLASNTSTLPITELAEVLTSPKRFVGIHFFSPVAKMTLIEIIQGKQTNKRAIDTAKSLTTIMQKTPILVKDIRGFYTSSVCMGYIYEAITLLTEGANPALIENAAKQIGMPAAPLALIDEIGIDIAWHILQSNQSDPKASLPNKKVIQLVDEMYTSKRLGRKTQKGFYEYHPQKHLWPELFQKHPQKTFSLEDIKSRLLNAQVSIANKIHQSGHITNEEANVGAILGLGFCPQTGGPIKA